MARKVEPLWHNPIGPTSPSIACKCARRLSRPKWSLSSVSQPSPLSSGSTKMARVSSSLSPLPEYDRALSASKFVHATALQGSRSQPKLRTSSVLIIIHTLSHGLVGPAESFIGWLLSHVLGRLINGLQSCSPLVRRHAWPSEQRGFPFAVFPVGLFRVFRRQEPTRRSKGHGAAALVPAWDSMADGHRVGAAPVLGEIGTSMSSGHASSGDNTPATHPPGTSVPLSKWSNPAKILGYGCEQYLQKT